ncbi:hypothetical protein ACA910_019167 [Epithemia clementina (nom. ined.)]
MHLPSDLPVGVAGLSRQRVPFGTGSWKIGIVYETVPFWAWVLGAGGRLQWTSSFQATRPDDALPSLQANVPSKPLHHHRGGVTWLEQVNAEAPATCVLYDNCSNGRTNEIWTLGSVQLVVWTDGKKRSGPPTLQLENWQTEQVILTHESLGGLLHWKSRINFAERISEVSGTSALDWVINSQSSGVKVSVLKGVLDPTIKGPTCRAPDADLGEDNVQWRKLHLDELDNRFRLPCVFSRSGYVRRLLSARELGGIFDFPLEVIKHPSDDWLQAWLSVHPIPFKIRWEVLRRLMEYSLSGESLSPPEPTRPRDTLTDVVLSTSHAVPGTNPL